MEYCPQIPRHCRVAAASIAGLLMLPALAFAALADPSAPQARFGTSVDQLGFPSLGRVVVVFVLTVALAVGAVVVLRRFWPTLLKRKNTATAIRSLDRTAISATLTVHVVEVEGVKMVVADGRNGVSIAILPATQLPPASDNTNLTP